jgi:hypothetical protein
MPVLSTVGAASLRAFGAFRQGTAAGFISATGGTITTSGNYKYHTFTSSGTFSVTSAPSGRTIDYILVAGGGGAAGQQGGGAGGVVFRTSQTPSSGSYSVVVGAGGAFNFANGTNGGDSTFFGITAIGGGAGRSQSSVLGSAGGSGGSGPFGGGAALQPTSASGGLGYNGGGLQGGGGGAGGAGSSPDGGPGYTDTVITGLDYAAGGPFSTDGTYLGPGNRGDGGGYEDDTGTGYSGLGGTVVIRYLYQ